MTPAHPVMRLYVDADRRRGHLLLWTMRCLTVAAFMLAAQGAHAAAYTDCKQYGGTGTCEVPDKTPWRMGADTMYFTDVPQPGAAPYCASVKAEQIAATTPDGAIAQYMAIFTQQFVIDCLLDVASITQQASCNALPEQQVLFNNTVQNRSSYPYWNKQVIAITSCDVRQYSLVYPGTYTQAPYPWRDTCGANSQAVQAPSGRVLCLMTSPKKEESDQPDCPNAKGDPIDLSNGNKFESAIDYSDETGNLTFKRYYNSNIDGAGMLGRAWVSEYDAHLYDNSDAVAYGGKEVMLAHRGMGARISLSPAGVDVFRADSADRTITVSVTRNSAGAISGYVLTDGVQLEQYGPTGLLTAIVRADGYTRTLAYDTSDRLLTVTDSFGRQLAFTYIATTAQKGYYIATMKTPAGAQYQYFYNQVGPNARLTQVIKPDTKSIQYSYDSAYRLTGKIDELGVPFSNFTYDANGDANGTSLAGNVDVVQTTRTLNTNGSLTVALNDKGVQVTDQYASLGGRFVLVSQNNPAGSGCAAATQATAYDANLNPVQVDQFGGARICRAFDLTRNLRMTEVAGLSSTDSCSAVLTAGATLPATAAKTSYQWHPDFKRPVRVASPKNLVTFVYNGQPDPTNAGRVLTCAPATALLPSGKPIAVLCKAVEQATIDLNGAAGFSAALDTTVPARVMSYTYNAQGQVLTQTDARNFTTNFAYYSATTASATLGDLQSITPPIGLATTFSSYNTDGFLLGMSDSNGLATSFAYDALNRTKQATVGSLTTTFTYDGKGRLTELDGAAGERAIYTYDAADRLTMIQDRDGNTIKLILDAAGHVVREEYQDPSGVLRRWLERGFDGLNRLSRVKGVIVQRP